MYLLYLLHLMSSLFGCLQFGSVEPECVGPLKEAVLLFCEGEWGDVSEEHVTWYKELSDSDVPCESLVSEYDPVIRYCNWQDKMIFCLCYMDGVGCATYERTFWWSCEDRCNKTGDCEAFCLYGGPGCPDVNEYREALCDDASFVDGECV